MLDVSGYACKIERDRLVHTENRHGINGSHDQSLSDPKDLARMGYVINNSDGIEWVVDGKGNRVFDKQYNDKNNKPSPVIMLNSKIDGTYCISQAVPDSKKRTIWITSVRIQKAAVGSQVPYDSNTTPQLQTSETPLNSSSASNNIIAEETQNINTSEEITEIQSYVSDNGYTVIDNKDARVITIKFDEKPSVEVRTALKDNAFVWNKTKGEWTRSGNWYAKNSVNDVITRLDNAYKSNSSEQSNSVETGETTPAETIEIETKMFHDIVDEVENDDTVSGKKR